MNIIVKQDQDAVQLKKLAYNVNPFIFLML